MSELLIAALRKRVSELETSYKFTCVEWERGLYIRKTRKVRITEWSSVTDWAVTVCRAAKVVRLCRLNELGRDISAVAGHRIKVINK